MNTKNKYKLTYITIYLILFFIISPLLIYAIGFKRDSPKIKNITYLTEMEYSINDGNWNKITLPHSFKNLEPGTKLSFKKDINPMPYDGIFVSSDFCTANVYLDNKLFFTLGKKENYPDFMLTPAREIHVVEAYGNGKTVSLQIDYFVGKYNNPLTVDIPLIGTSKEIILERSVKYGLSWMFSFSQIIAGFSLILISFFLIFVDKKGILFAWLGLFALSSGFWFFGSNSFSMTSFPHSTFLYISSYIGFAFCTMPLLRFLTHSVNFKNPRPLIITETIYGLLILFCIILQLLGILPLHISWNLFRLLAPAYFLLINLLTIYERIKWDNRYAEKFIIPTHILLISAIAETINTNLTNKIFPSSTIFQTGTFIFLLLMGINAGRFIKDSMNLKKMEEDLKNQKSLLDIITAEQKCRSLALAKNETILSRQRHDLRHHISAISELSKGNKELEQYLSTLMKKIPSKLERYCENDIINAIISHYASLCELDNINFKTVLNIPVNDDFSVTSDLCVIFSNLLENAYEACKRLDYKENKFIIIKSSLNRNILTITMDNSFNGEVIHIGEKYKSAKRNDYGIGLESIKSISRQYHGDANFTYENNVFYSSIYIVL